MKSYFFFINHIYFYSNECIKVIIFSHAIVNDMYVPKVPLTTGNASANFICNFVFSISIKTHFINKYTLSVQMPKLLKQFPHFFHKTRLFVYLLNHIFEI